MRIIGETNGGFIAEISKSEVANVLGIYSEYSDDWRAAKVSLGSTIDVNAIYHRAERSTALRKELSSATASLRSVADFVDTVTNPVSNPPVEEGTESK